MKKEVREEVVQGYRMNVVLQVEEWLKCLWVAVLLELSRSTIKRSLKSIGVQLRLRPQDGLSDRGCRQNRGLRQLGQVQWGSEKVQRRVLAYPDEHTHRGGRIEDEGVMEDCNLL